MRLPAESRSIIRSLNGAFVRSFGPRFICSGSDRVGGEPVSSPLAVDCHARTRVDVAMYFATSDAGPGIDVAADGTAGHPGAGVDVSTNGAACDALPSVHVTSNHAAMNVPGDLEILQEPLDNVNLNSTLHAILLPHIIDQDFAAFGDADTMAAERAAVDDDPCHGRRLQEQSGQFVARAEFVLLARAPLVCSRVGSAVLSPLKIAQPRQRMRMTNALQALNAKSQIGRAADVGSQMRLVTSATDPFPNPVSAVGCWHPRQAGWPGPRRARPQYRLLLHAPQLTCA